MAVNTRGDVPQANNAFGTNTVDADLNNILDTIDSQGNNVYSYLADANDPLGPSPSNGNNLPWNAPTIWSDYETSQNILVGQTGPGEIEINGGTSLRYQHVVLGGHGEFGVTSGILNLQATTEANSDQSADFAYQAQIDNSALSTNGLGILTVVGFGSTLNLNPGVIEGEWQNVFRIYHEAAGTTWDGTVPDDSGRPTDKGFNCFVGLKGSGKLYVEAGGSVLVQNRLLVGMSEGSFGNVEISGSGSTLAAYGESSVGITSTTEPWSLIGDEGNGVLIVKNGAKASFLGGLRCGENGSIVVTNAEIKVSQVGGTPEQNSYINGTWSLEGNVSIGNLLSRAIIRISETTTVTGSINNLAPESWNDDADDQTAAIELEGGSIVITGGTVVFNSPIENRGTIVVAGCAKVFFEGGLSGDGTLLASDSALVMRRESTGMVKADTTPLEAN